MESSKENKDDKKPLLGEILVKRKLLTDKQLGDALAVQKQDKGLLGEV